MFHDGSDESKELRILETQSTNFITINHSSNNEHRIKSSSLTRKTLETIYDRKKFREIQLSRETRRLLKGRDVRW